LQPGPGLAGKSGDGLQAQPLDKHQGVIGICAGPVPFSRRAGRQPPAIVFRQNIYWMNSMPADLWAMTGEVKWDSWTGENA
jgi:hypothetical protein